MGAYVITRKNFAVSKDSKAREKALAEVMRANGPKLTSLVRRLVQDQTEAEDVLQDVFEEFLIAYDLGATIERVSAWLVTVARNKIFDRFRRKRTRVAYGEAILASNEENPSSNEWTRSWLRKEIAQALALLPPEQRQVFVMHELEGKSFKEIAAQTGTPLGTLLARKKYAVDFLRNYLKEIYDELES